MNFPYLGIRCKKSQTHFTAGLIRLRSDIKNGSGMGIMKLFQIFTEHPASAGETYGEHMMVAFSFSGAMLRGGIACLIHGLFPFLFTRTGSGTVAMLYGRMVVSRNDKTSAAWQNAPGD